MKLIELMDGVSYMEMTRVAVFAIAIIAICLGLSFTLTKSPSKKT